MARGGKRPGAGRKANATKAAAASNQPKAKVGRPSAYQPLFTDQAKKLCELGATDVELADFFGVSINTIGNWKTAHPGFLGALKVGKEVADDRVERSLYNRATGYTFDAVKIMTVAGEAVTVPYREHMPPDVTACIFWLKNRRRDEWRDRYEHDLEHNRKHIDAALGDMSDDELNHAIAVLKSAGDAGGGNGGRSDERRAKP